MSVRKVWRLRAGRWAALKHQTLRADTEAGGGSAGPGAVTGVVPWVGAESLTYGVAISLFAFVVCAAGFVRHEMAILACIPPVFVALIAGFAMWGHLFGLAGISAGIVALLPGYPAARHLGRRFGTRDMLIAIYLAWTVGMVVARIGFSFPDVP